jgi:arginase
MPLRMAIDEGSIAPSEVALVGARDLDPPEAEYLARQGIDDDLSRALAGATAVYVALDVDVLEPGEVPCFMPVAGGPDTQDVVRLIREVAGRAQVAGLGITGLVPGADPETLKRFAVAAGL